MYDKGKGVAQSDKETVAWYRKAANQGSVNAQVIMGLRYTTGKGVEKSYKKSVVWYQKAAKQGDKIAQDVLTALGEEW